MNKRVISILILIILFCVTNIYSAPVGIRSGVIESIESYNHNAGTVYDGLLLVKIKEDHGAILPCYIRMDTPNSKTSYNLLMMAYTLEKNIVIECPDDWEVTIEGHYRITWINLK